MSDPNLITVFDKNGEPFETSRANARDLVTHVGWTYGRPKVVEKIVEVATPAAPVVETLVAPVAEVETPAAPVVEAPAAPVVETEVATPAATALLTTVEAFEDFGRDEVVAYLTENFPAATYHHKTGRDKLVELAISLASE